LTDVYYIAEPVSLTFFLVSQEKGAEPARLSNLTTFSESTTFTLRLSDTEKLGGTDGVHSCKVWTTTQHFWLNIKFGRSLMSNRCRPQANRGRVQPTNQDNINMIYHKICFWGEYNLVLCTALDPQRHTKLMCSTETKESVYRIYC